MRIPRATATAPRTNMLLLSIRQPNVIYGGLYYGGAAFVPVVLLPVFV